jgi:hypothetical protein
MTPFGSFMLGVFVGVAWCLFAGLGIFTFLSRERAKDRYLAAPPMLFIAIVAGAIGSKYDANGAYGFACVLAVSAVVLAMVWCMSSLTRLPTP